MVIDHISDGLESLNLSRDLLDYLTIENETGLELQPRVSLENNRIHLKLPLLYLLERNDAMDLSKSLQDRVLSIKEGKNLSIFFECVADPTMSLKVKRFVLFHELSHIFLNHLMTPSLNNRESRTKEREADLNAIKISPSDLEGGIFLMETMSRYFPNQEPTTHPSYETRAHYLSALRADPVDCKTGD